MSTVTATRSELLARRLRESNAQLQPDATATVAWPLTAATQMLPQPGQ